MIHPSTIEEIKSRVDIVEVVSDFVSLKRSGSSYKALSPFTGEKTASFFVVPSKGIFKDFSSGKGGDAINFIMEIDGLSYVEALRYLAGKYGIEIVEEGQEQSDEALKMQNKRESLYIVLSYANQYFQETLHHSKEGKSIGLTYFKERGFSEDVIKRFELGYSKEIWDGLLNAAVKNGYSKELLQEAGLIVTKGDNSYDRFRGRVMFPIHNVSGKPIAFGGRILIKQEKQPKYVNSPETMLYVKSKVLYGLYQSKQEIRKKGYGILVEGYTDVIALHQAGIENVVASSGTALTDGQIKLIRRYTENVTIIFDGDPAGMRASLRGIDLLLQEDVNVKAVALPENEDPDSYVRKLGADAFGDFIVKESQDIIRFKTGILLNEAGNDPIKKAAAIKDIVISISKINDSIKRSIYTKECSSLLGISESALITEQNKILIHSRGRFRNTPLPEPGTVEESPQDLFLNKPDIGQIIELQEKESIRLLVNYGKNKIRKHTSHEQYLADYFLNELEEVQFTNQTYQKIMDLFKVKLKEGEIIDNEYLLSHPDEEVKQTVIDLVTNKYEISDAWHEKYKIHVPVETEFLKDAAYTNILRLKFRIIQHLIREENKKLKEAGTEVETNEFLDEINELKKMEMEIAGILGNVLV